MLRGKCLKIIEEVVCNAPLLNKEKTMLCYQFTEALRKHKVKFNSVAFYQRCLCGKTQEKQFTVLCSKCMTPLMAEQIASGVWYGVCPKCHSEETFKENTT